MARARAITTQGFGLWAVDEQTGSWLPRGDCQFRMMGSNVNDDLYGIPLDANAVSFETIRWDRTRDVICVALGTAVGFVVIDPRFLSLASGLRVTELALLGLLVGTAAMLAELPNSFLKRRMGIAPGAQTGGIRGVAFHVLDQIDVLFGAWAVLAWVARPTMGRLGGALGTVYIGHQLVSLVGYWLGMRTSAR